MQISKVIVFKNLQTYRDVGGSLYCELNKFSSWNLGNYMLKSRVSKLTSVESVHYGFVSVVYVMLDVGGGDHDDDDIK